MRWWGPIPDYTILPFDAAALQTGQELRCSLESREEDVTRLKSDKLRLEEQCRQREDEMKVWTRVCAL